MLVKNKTEENIQAIAGATISSRAVMTAVKKSIDDFHNRRKN